MAVPSQLMPKSLSAGWQIASALSSGRHHRSGPGSPIPTSVGLTFANERMAKKARHVMMEVRSGIVVSGKFGVLFDGEDGWKGN